VTTPDYEINSLGELSAADRREILEHDFGPYWYGGVALEEIAQGTLVAPAVLAELFCEHAKGGL